jgi:hypothetical protein
MSGNRFEHLLKFAESLLFIQEADQHGGTQTLLKHNLSHSVFLRWKHQFDQGGSASLKPGIAN